MYAVPEEVNLVCVSLDDNSWESEGLTTEVELGVVICKTLIFLFVVVLRNKEVKATCKRRSNKGSCQLATDKTGKSFPTGSVQVSDKFKKPTGVNTLERADTKGVHASGIENECKYSCNISYSLYLYTALW